VNAQVEDWQSFFDLLAHNGDECASIDALYERIDDLLWTENTANVDAACAVAAGHPTLPLVLLLGVLTMTLPWRERLVSRPLVVARAEEVTRAKGEDVESMLAGLR